MLINGGVAIRLYPWPSSFPHCYAEDIAHQIYRRHKAEWKANTTNLATIKKSQNVRSGRDLKDHLVNLILNILTRLSGKTETRMKAPWQLQGSLLTHFVLWEAVLLRWEKWTNDFSVGAPGLEHSVSFQNGHGRWSKVFSPGSISGSQRKSYYFNVTCDNIKIYLFWLI